MEIKAFKEAIGDLKDVLGFLGFRPATDAEAGTLITVKAVTTDTDPGAVERNVEKNAEALERAQARNKDCGLDEFPEGETMTEEEKKKMAEKKEGKDESGEMKKEEKGATPPKEAADGARDAATADALGRVADALDRLNKRMDAAEANEKKAEEKKDEPKVEDSELIPVPTLAKEDIPENPIPGAPKSVDRAAVIAGLLALKPAIAATKNRDAALAWNRAYREAKGVKDSGADAYVAMAGRTEIAKPDATRMAEEAGRQRGTADTAGDANDFAEQARAYHRRNAVEVKNEKARVN